MTDQEDYLSMLQEFGFTPEWVREQSEDPTLLVPFPVRCEAVHLSRSKIEGEGLFASVKIPAGIVIAPASFRGMKTPAGRYTNHSGDPNATFIPILGDLYLISIKEIQGMEEITIDYRIPLGLHGYVPLSPMPALPSE